MCKPQLPAETWSAIIEFLPLSQQRPCLFVSRLHHDLAIRFLFSVVKVHFISESLEETFGCGHNVAPSLMARSWEILDYIAHEPNFAKVVKTVVVYAFAAGLVVFERRCLTKALQALPNLRSFHWFGSFPDFPSDISESLSTHCSRLQHISLPERIDNLSVHSLNGLTQLRQLQLITPRSWLGSNPSIFIESLDDINLIINSNSATLRKLTLNGIYIGDMPIRVFNSLTQLEISFSQAEGFRGMDFVFHHATGLESLSLVGYINFDMFPLLRKYSTALPHLTSFRLSSLLEQATEEHWQGICEFLRGRVALRKLCLRLLGPWKALDAVFPVISGMSELQVLGLHTGRGLSEEEDYAYLASCLPPKLMALNIAISWGGLSDPRVLSPLWDKLGQLPYLFFLHINCGSQWEELPISPEDLASDLKHLETLGLQGCMWDIDRTESEIVLSEWSALKVRRSVVEDFRSEDEEWLVRYQAQNNQFL